MVNVPMVNAPQPHFRNESTPKAFANFSPGFALEPWD